MRTGITVSLWLFYRFSRRQRRRYHNLVLHGFSPYFAACAASKDWQLIVSAILAAVGCVAAAALLAFGMWAMLVLGLGLDSLIAE